MVVVYSLGCGYRKNHVFFDIAYKFSKLKYSHQVHEISDTNPSGGDAVADLSEKNQQLIFTIGYQF